MLKRIWEAGLRVCRKQRKWSEHRREQRNSGNLWVENRVLPLAGQAYVWAAHAIRV
jgi:hypothetical protein